MQVATIPWPIFFEALKDQQRSVVEMWLGRWRFTNEGVLRADSPSLSSAEVFFSKQFREHGTRSPRSRNSSRTETEWKP